MLLAVVASRFILKCHWKEFFFLVFLLFRTYETPLQKRFCPKQFLVMFFALQNVAFSTSERRMLPTVKRSRDKSLWRKKLCYDSAVISKMADSKKKTVFVESFRGRDQWKNKLHEWFLNTGRIVSYFPQKLCHQAEMAEICAETVLWTSRLRVHVQCRVLDILRTLVQLTAFSWSSHCWSEA